MPQTIEWLAENYDLDPRVVAGVKELIAAEREACAQRLDDEADAFLDGQSLRFEKVCREMAAAIRNRTNAN